MRSSKFLTPPPNAQRLHHESRFHHDQPLTEETTNFEVATVQSSGAHPVQVFVGLREERKENKC
jgi:hypothetical protein